MITKGIFGWGVVLAPVGIVSATFAGTPPGTGFSYQGQLKQDGLPFTGLADLEFSLHPDPVTPDQIGTDYRIDAVEVVNGLFNVNVDFGAEALAGSARWLEVRVRAPHDPTDVVSFVTLDPRQEIRPTPYATHAQSSSRPFREEGADAVFEGGNVGIGTSNPTAMLEVAGPGLFGGDILSNAAGPFQIGHTGEYGLEIDASNGRTHLMADGTRLLTVDASRRVGVGTQSPGALFHVAGRSRFDGSMFFNTLEPFEIAHDNNTGMVIDPISNTVSLEADNGVALTADASGRVGIGVTGPTADLHVRGSRGLRVDNAAGTPVLSATGGGNVGIGTTAPQAKLHVKDGDAGVAPNTNSRFVVERNDSTFINVLVPETDQCGILFGNPADGSAAGGVVYNSSNSRDGMQFRTNGNVARMTVTGSGDVGIGTTAPEAKLHVAGDLQIEGEIRGPRTQRHRLLTATDFVADPSIVRSRGSVGIGVTATPLSTTAYATIDLPNGAVIKAVSALVRDSDDEIGDDVRISLVSQGFSSTTDVIVNGQTSGSPGLTLVEFVTNAVVDKENIDYFIEARFINNFVFNQGSKRLYAVDVLYETDAIEP